MKSNLIIEASDRLAWHQRFASTASTAALWGGWLWLWAPLLKAVGHLAHLGPKLSVWGLEALPAGGPGWPLSIAAIAGIPGTVVAWRKLPRRRAKVEPALPVSEYARRFELHEQVIEAGRRATVSVVHHHPDGRIAGIDCRAPDGRVVAAGPLERRDELHRGAAEVAGHDVADGAAGLRD
jgi:poly-beta-1,6-N-acetyl-D-glucosamine biosynthesis protein PgaD